MRETGKRFAKGSIIANTTTGAGPYLDMRLPSLPVRVDRIVQIAGQLVANTQNPGNFYFPSRNRVGRASFRSDWGQSPWCIKNYVLILISDGC